METVGAYEAKTHLSNLLERVIQGERITITKHGVPVAVLQPPETICKRNPAEVISEVRELRAKYSLKGLSIREMFEEGRS
ncbi:MAG: type II toxin-antitoxin system prevent-host-death family antitoxin [Spirochaetaceae bacterium]|nr:type II toxin-antitoxin system prevent-host-death family antitoxin [Spirochaetaceae bacterium]